MENITAMVEGQAVLANAKTFSTGSKGFFGSGKLVIDGKKYQTQVQMVEIGSKPADPAKDKKK
jgi:hypothetical protein